MSQYILLNRVQVQNANAVAGFTWGFPAITHFLGFTHLLNRKLVNTSFSNLVISGVAVVAHEHYVHTYGKYKDRFTQSRNPPYLRDLKKENKAKVQPIIEEGKMNMTVSLLIQCEGNVGNQSDDLLHWLEKQCYLQRMAGGSVQGVASVQLLNLENNSKVRELKRKLLPGFILVDRSAALEDHCVKLEKKTSSVDPVRAWMDFAAYKEQARPKHDQIDKHLEQLKKLEPQKGRSLMQDWTTHKNKVPYQKSSIPKVVKEYFDRLESTPKLKSLLRQWKDYVDPTDETLSDWEKLPNPTAKGYLIPIVCGYKAIMPVYPNDKVANTRDSKTPVCFVEAVHSVGEWKSVHRLKSESDVKDMIWNYQYEEHWYLCRQRRVAEGPISSSDEEF